MPAQRRAARAGDRHQRCLRAGAVVRRTRKFEFGLDADINSLGRRDRCAGRDTRALANFVIEIGGSGDACRKGSPDWESSGSRCPRRARYCSRRRETSRRHSGSGVSASELAPTVTGSGISPRSAAGASQKEQLSVSSSKRAPHFEQMRITGPFCAAEDPVERENHITRVRRWRATGSPPVWLIRQHGAGRSTLMQM